MPAGRRGASPENVLVLRLGNVGDTVVALPAFHALRRRFPEARMTLLTSPTRRGAPGAREVLENDDTFGDLWIYYEDESQRPDFLRGLRRKIAEVRIDLAVALPNQLSSPRSLVKYVLLLASCGVRRFEGFTLVRRGKHERPQVERLAELLAPLGADGIEALPWLRPNAAAEEHAATLLAPFEGRCLIGMHCGAARPANQWFPERFAALGRRLADDTGAAIVLTGGPGETALTARLAQEIGAAALDLAGKTTIGELAAAALRCKLFIANDNGAMHVAYAAGAPVLALFSARFHRNVWYPYGPASRVLRAEIPCSPCHADTCPIDARTPCLEALSVDAAYATAMEMLTKNGD